MSTSKESKNNIVYLALSHHAVLTSDQLVEKTQAMDSAITRYQVMEDLQGLISDGLVTTFYIAGQTFYTRGFN